jgi:Meiotically up-regulated gene 113
MVTREHILAEIRRTAEANGGRALGKGRFAGATGIRESDWAGRFWARWSDAVRDAGVDGNLLTVRIDDGYVIARLADEIQRLGRFPTGHELTLRRREDPTLPSEKVFRRLGGKALRAKLVADFCAGHPEYSNVARIVTPLIAQDEPETMRVPERVEYGTVYLLKSGRHYKLGRTNSFGRREYEIGLQLPERAATVHVIKTEDPVGIEDYWHRRFSDRRRNGEWFELTQADVRAFKRHKVM